MQQLDRMLSKTISHKSISVGCCQDSPVQCLFMTMTRGRKQRAACSCGVHISKLEKERMQGTEFALAMGLVVNEQRKKGAEKAKEGNRHGAAVFF